MSLPVTAVTSLVLHERLQPVHWWAVLLVSAGLVLLSVGSGEPGALFTSAWFAVAAVGRRRRASARRPRGRALVRDR